MSSKVQGQLRITSFDKLSPSSSRSLYMHLSEYLIEPRQDALADMIESINIHHLLISYFEASFEASNVCGLLLRSIHQTRANYKIIKRVIKQTKRVHDHTEFTDDQCRPIFGELAKFALLNNPLSAITPVQFHDIHDGYKALLRQLTSKQKKIRRKAKFRRLCKKVAAFSLVMSCGALTIALLVCAIHSVVGIVAAPGLVACSLGLFKKRIKMTRRWLGTSLLERLGAQLDFAAKGVYILINDFDTMGRLVGRLHDEVEHSKAIASMCVRNGKGKVLKEVVKEFHVHEACFMEQLEELEDHVYLCFLTINRSRRLVIQEIMAGWPRLSTEGRGRHMLGNDEGRGIRSNAGFDRGPIFKYVISDLGQVTS
ncbi:hypothetical protein L1049_026983 [Liquidambar formosana]|uniref:Uncharacterized protein n=1 Tax=Liquidambar formosana TaxID=63359 RepID=A0AAP0R8G7_LIQFO